MPIEIFIDNNKFIGKISIDTIPNDRNKNIKIKIFFTYSSGLYYFNFEDWNDNDSWGKKLIEDILTLINKLNNSEPIQKQKIFTIDKLNINKNYDSYPPSGTLRDFKLELTWFK